MYRRSIIDAAVQDALQEMEGEFEGAVSTVTNRYYWDVWYQADPASQRIHKNQTPPQTLDPGRINSLEQQLFDDWFRRLQYQSGTFFMYRYTWDGKKWAQEECYRGDLASRVVYRC